LRPASVAPALTAQPGSSAATAVAGFDCPFGAGFAAFGSAADRVATCDVAKLR
jgi:hypothetical protein